MTQQQIKVGDRVKCFVRNHKQDGTISEYWAVGQCYHIGDKVLAFEADNGHIYGVKIEHVELA